MTCRSLGPRRARESREGRKRLYRTMGQRQYADKMPEFAVEKTAGSPTPWRESSYAINGKAYFERWNRYG